MPRIPRPCAYHPKIAGEICRRIAEGETLAAVCGPGRAKGMPAVITVYNWVNRFPQFRQAYLVARMAQAERQADEMVEIADGGGTDLGTLRRDRLRMEARRWRVGAMAPERYAQRLAAMARAEADAEPQMDEREMALKIVAILEAAEK